MSVCWYDGGFRIQLFSVGRDRLFRDSPSYNRFTWFQIIWQNACPALALDMKVWNRLNIDDSSLLLLSLNPASAEVSDFNQGGW
jgi:hypothetical protein